MYSPVATQDSILRVGRVVEVHGRKVIVEVDKLKNHPDLLYNGGVIRNIAVDSYIEIRKGFLCLIGKVDGEQIKEEPRTNSKNSDEQRVNIKRLLTVSLVGYIDCDDRFEGGTKELPLIGNEAFVVSAEKSKIIHQLVEAGELSITIAETDDGILIPFPIDGLFNGHIAIFGNTGSGKSNTLASLFQALVSSLREKDRTRFTDVTKFLAFDFNGEFGPGCFTDEKHVYTLSTEFSNASKIPMLEDELLDLELLSILSDATEKTQKPFLKRTLKMYNRFKRQSPPFSELRQHIEDSIHKILLSEDKDTAPVCLELMEKALQFCPSLAESNLTFDVAHNYNTSAFYIRSDFTGHQENDVYFNNHPQRVKCTRIYKSVERFSISETALRAFFIFAHLRLIVDIQDFGVKSDHIAPMLHRLQGKIDEIDKVFDTSDVDADLWKEHNFVVIDLSYLEPEIKKSVPLLVCKLLYSKHKQLRAKKSLNIIIDEAHQILSRHSVREEDSLKDYRLEVFEEIIKEGRKFGVFVTLASQRPHDISETISSQAHNYFIHRLINQHDLNSVSTAVAYIDRLAEESIPSLPTGTCIFSGVASRRPIKIHIRELPDSSKPMSKTLAFSELLE